MKAGDTVICTGSRGYAFTTGKEYAVQEYEPAWFDTDAAAGFTWPAYVIVIDDDGRKVHCHASRFREP